MEAEEEEAEGTEAFRKEGADVCPSALCDFCLEKSMVHRFLPSQ